MIREGVSLHGWLRLAELYPPDRVFNDDEFIFAQSVQHTADIAASGTYAFYVVVEYVLVH